MRQNFEITTPISCVFNRKVLFLIDYSSLQSILPVTTIAVTARCRRSRGMRRMLAAKYDLREAKKHEEKYEEENAAELFGNGVIAGSVLSG